MSNAARVEALFFAALERETVAEQVAFLNSACGGDAELRRQVEKMLNAHPKVGNFLHKPAIEGLAEALNSTGAASGLDTSADGFNEKDEALHFLQPSGRPDSLGRLGHYEILQVLGKGGFGMVYRAFDETLQRVVAVKVLAPHLAATSPPRKRFLREARSSAKVRHDNVVHVYAVEEQPVPYLVMEFVPGETLQQRLDRIGPLEAQEVVRIGLQLAEGLAAAHAQSLIHRDIKPGNILIEGGPHPRVKITDFGLARAADDASLTQSGMVAGTPMFMAPEQALGEPLDHRADLFSLGSVLYTMCAGRPPFRANNTVAVLKRVADDTPRPITDIIPETPQWLCDLISRLHAKKPEDRFASAQEVADLLARHLDKMLHPDSSPTLPELPPVAAKTPAKETPQPTQKVKPRSRARLWMAAAVLVLIILGGFGISEATGVTNVRGTVIRLLTPEGTLVVEVDDPEVKIQIDGSDLVITGGGVQEIRLKAGNHKVEASKDGKVVRQELVTVTKNGREIVRVSQEPIKKDDPAAPFTDADVKRIAALPAAQQVEEVRKELKRLNPNFNEALNPTIEGGVVTGLAFDTDRVADISPVRALTQLKKLFIHGSSWDKGLLVDLSPLKGMKLTELNIGENKVSDLTPLKGMPLEWLAMWQWKGTDMTPLKGMPLRWLNCGGGNRKLDLTQLAGLPLEYLCLNHTEVSDLTPLKDMPLKSVEFTNTFVTDASPLSGIKSLKKINLMPAEEFWKKAGAPGNDPDRRAAEYVLSIGGTVRLDGDGRDIKAAAELPKGAFRLSTVGLIVNNRVTDAGLAALKDCKNLTVLDLVSTPVTDAGLAHLKDCKNLTDLFLAYTQVTDAGLAHFKDCKNLTKVNLHKSRVTDVGLAVLKDCKNLSELNLSALPVTDPGLAALKDCKNLTWLVLNDTQVTDAGLGHFAGLDQLRLLRLLKTQVTAKGIEGLAKALPKCKIEWDGGVNEPK